MRGFLSGLGLSTCLLLTGCEQLNLNTLVSGLGSLVNSVKGDGVIKSEERPLDGRFETLDIQAPIEVEYSQSDSDKGLTLTADSNILPLIQTTVSNNRLLVKLAQSYDSATQVKMLLKGPALSEVIVSAPAKVSLLALSGKQPLSVEASGAASVLLSGPASDSLKLKGSGSSELEIRDLKGQKAEVSLTESSALRAYGSLDSLTLTADGASRLLALNLRVTEAQLTFERASKGSLTVSSRLQATLSGASELTYGGNPQLIPNLSGASSLRPVTGDTSPRPESAKL
ncbi:MAG: DUF2807 domain-containing protein [Candidatus Sericytochromatia bacterium]|nr:DUF2807 domain-containing protein [Candidatus Sericytochromatia bacterium]